MTAPLHIEYATIIQRNTEGFREELVKIAFDRLLRRSLQEKEWKWADIALGAVAAADDVLAAMNKADSLVDKTTAYADAMDATPDTGPSAKEIERRARTLAGGVLDGVEKPILARIRAEIQARLDADAVVYAKNPTTNLHVGGYREGDRLARKEILAMIDAAMEKTPEDTDGD